MKKFFLFLTILLSLFLVACDSGDSSNSNNENNGNNGSGENSAIENNTIVPVLLKNYIGRRVSYTIIDNNADTYKEGFLAENEEQIIKSYKKGNYKVKFKVSPWSDVITCEFSVNKKCILGFSGTSYPWNFSASTTGADFEVDNTPKTNVSVVIRNPFGSNISYSIIDDEAEVYKSGTLAGGENQSIASFKTGKYKMKFYVSPWNAQLNLTEFSVLYSRDIVFAGTSSPWNFYLTE